MMHRFPHFSLLPKLSHEKTLKLGNWCWTLPNSSLHEITPKKASQIFLFVFLLSTNRTQGETTTLSYHQGKFSMGCMKFWLGSHLESDLVRANTTAASPLSYFSFCWYAESQTRYPSYLFTDLLLCHVFVDLKWMTTSCYVVDKKNLDWKEIKTCFDTSFVWFKSVKWVFVWF